MQVQRELDRYRHDAVYFEEHRADLLADYAEQSVAIYNRRVAASAERLPDLLNKLDQAGLPRCHVFIEHLSREEDVLILLVQ